MEETKSRRPEDTPFKQQRLKAWQPILTPNWVIGTFAFVGLLFIPIGVVLHIASDDVVEYSVQYDGVNVPDNDNVVDLGQGCKLTIENDSNTFDVEKRGCLISIKLGQDMKKPIYLYYQLDNFYQNHRRYVQSRSDAQLRGQVGASTTDCSPMKTTPNPVIKYNSIFGALNSTPTTYNLNPCGLIANSLFNDIFWINSVTLPDRSKYYQNDQFPGASVSTVNLLDQTGIAWKSDIETKFKNIPNDSLSDADLYLWQNQRYRFIIPEYPGQEPKENKTAWTSPAPAYGVQDEHFVVWMRTAGLPNFRKLYGKIDHDLKEGTVIEFLVSSNFLVTTFDGKKSLVIATTSWFGGKNPFLGVAYIVVGSVCMLLAILFFAKHKLSPRKLGDTRYLVWKANN